VKNKPTQPGLTEERRLWRAGFERIAGIDEAGRGAWAGPVVAGAVILPPVETLHATSLQEHTTSLRGVRDSKMLTPAQRETLYPIICQTALAWGVGQASHAEIDTLGIVPATRLAMARAVQALAIQPDALLIDAIPLPDLPLYQQMLYHADSICLSVAAASILAKVTRDRLMIDLDAQYPHYGFARHKGYGTQVHQKALAQWGPADVHRKTFRPVALCDARHSKVSTYFSP
jgi:ribonuclease HII